MPLFWIDTLVFSYSDLHAAKHWAKAFECKEVAVPPDWDDPLPSDVALIPRR
jgi:hypothetical protein